MSVAEESVLSQVVFWNRRILQRYFVWKILEVCFDL